MEDLGNLQPAPDNAIVWREGCLYLLDQRVLPQREEYLALHSAAEVAAAIHGMVVRGAPAIGITAAYGAVLAARQRFRASAQDWAVALQGDLELLARARPTAVNLAWAIARMRRCVAMLGDDADPELTLLREAQAMHAEDVVANHTIGDLGAGLIERTTNVITHCNAGALATGGYGTALGVIRSAHAVGKVQRVFAGETRPWMQGARLTAWELNWDRIPVTLLVDGAAASRMRQGDIDWVIVGADRIAANGDVANKIGTYGLAVAARHHGVRFMVAAPTSTLDLAAASGDDIPIETRAAAELLSCAGNPVAASGSEAWNPVFDVTPAALIDALVTERGVIVRPNAEKIGKLMMESPETR